MAAFVQILCERYL